MVRYETGGNRFEHNNIDGSTSTIQNMMTCLLIISSIQQYHDLTIVYVDMFKCRNVWIGVD